MTLKLTDVTKQFGKFTAVDHLSLEIPEKEIFGFLGGNGAGKTTTFRIILGLLTPTAGEISWNNKLINYDTSHLVGYLPEERGLYPKLKVKDQLIYLARLRGMSKQEAERVIKVWLERFKVPNYIDKKVEELSKGNQQKIQFLAAVIHKPKLLILDEPFSGLDPINVEQLKEAVFDLRENGTSIVFSSHRMEHVEELCENLCILQKGKPVVHGNMKDIKRSFGRKNVIIQADFPLKEFATLPGVIKYTESANGSKFQVENEEVAGTIFNALSNKGFVRKFIIDEPTLNDIFIEKAGASYE